MLLGIYELGYTQNTYRKKDRQTKGTNSLKDTSINKSLWKKVNNNDTSRKVN